MEDVFLRCPFCGTTLKRHCTACHRIIDADSRFCPHCGAATGSGEADPAQEVTVTAPSTATGNQV